MLHPISLCVSRVALVHEKVFRDQTVTKLLPNRDKLKLWLREIDKNPGFIGAPYKIRTCDPRFRNKRDCAYE